MTAKQKLYYESIRSFIERNRRSPSFEEIARMMGVNSLATVHRVVSVLEGQGLITRTPGRSTYNIEIVPQRMHSMNSCNRQHPPIWFMTHDCPLCEALDRLTPQRALTVAAGEK